MSAQIWNTRDDEHANHKARRCDVFGQTLFTVRSNEAREKNVHLRKIPRTPGHRQISTHTGRPSYGSNYLVLPRKAQKH